jgi:hypothetical protein
MDEMQALAAQALRELLDNPEHDVTSGVNL